VKERFQKRTLDLAKNFERCQIHGISTPGPLAGVVQIFWEFFRKFFILIKINYGILNERFISINLFN
jgi:hypothetical protein